MLTFTPRLEKISENTFVQVPAVWQYTRREFDRYAQVRARRSAYFEIGQVTYHDSVMMDAHTDFLQMMRDGVTQVASIDGVSFTVVPKTTYSVSISRACTIHSFGATIVTVEVSGGRSYAGFVKPRVYNFPSVHKFKNVRVRKASPEPKLPTYYHDATIRSQPYPEPIRKPGPRRAEEKVFVSYHTVLDSCRANRSRGSKVVRRFIEDHNKRAARELSDMRKKLRPQSGVAAGVVAGAAIAGVTGSLVRRLVRSVRKQAHEVVNSATDKLDALSDKVLEAIGVNTDKLADPLSSLVGGVQKHVPTFVGHLRDAVVVALLIAAIHKRSSTFAVIAGALAVLLPGESFAVRLVRRALNRARTTLEPQAGFDAKAVGTAAAVTLLATTLFKQKTFRNTCFISSFLASVGNFERLSSGWEGFVSFFGHLLERFISFAGSLVGKKWNVCLIRDPYPDITRLTVSVSDFATKVRLGKITVNCATVRSVRSFLSEEAKLKVRHHGARKAMTAMTVLTRDMTYLQEAFGPLITGKTGQRPQPPVVMLCGPPGVGKSLLTTDILDFVLSETLDPEVKSALGNDFSGEMYLYPVEEDYANGYAGQACAIFEDVGLGVTALGDRKADFLRIASLANPYSKPLDQAAIAGKGNSFFQSDVIYCTTNVYNVTSYVEGHIHEPKALIRRITVPYRVELRPEWSETRDGVTQLNSEKYRQFRLANPGHQPDAWIFTRWDYDTGRCSHPLQQLNLTSFKLTIVREIMRNRDFHTSSSEYRRQINLAHTPTYVPGMTIPTIGETPVTPVVLQPQASDESSDEDLDSFATYRSYIFGSIDPPVEVQNVCELLTIEEDADPSFLDDHITNDICFSPPDALTTYTPTRLLANVRLGHGTVAGRNVTVLYNELFAQHVTGAGVYTGPTVVWKGFEEATAAEKVACLLYSDCLPKADGPSLAARAKGLCASVKRFFSNEVVALSGVCAAITALCLAPMLVKAVCSCLGSFFSFFVSVLGAPFGVAKKVIRLPLRKKKRVLVRQSNEEPPMRVRPFVNHVVKPQGLASSIMVPASTREAIVNKAQANTYAVYTTPLHVVGFCTFVRDNIMMMPYHYLHTFQKTTSPEVRFVNTVTGAGFSLTTDVLKSVDDSLGRPARVDMPDLDLLFYKVPLVRAHSDIVTYYASKSVTDMRPKGVSVAIRSFRPVYDKPAVTTTSYAQNCVHLRDFGYGDTYGQKVRVGYTYAVGFNHGDCGSITYFSSDPKQEQAPLIGMHVAGLDKLHGTCNIISRETLEDACLAFNAVKTVVEGTPYEKVLEPHVGASNHVNMAIVYKTATPHNINLRTELRESELFGAYGNMPKCAPNFSPFVAPDGSTIVPLHKALAPYATEVRQLDPREIREAMTSALRPLNSLTLDHTRDIYDFETAVEGIPGVFKGIPRGTSSGGQYILQGVTNKRVIFGTDEYVFDTPLALQCKANVTKILEDAAAGVRQPHLYVEFPKDELLKRRKVEEEGKVRLISACPLDLMVATRMMFLSFTTAVMSTKIDNHMAVGINPYKDWDRLASRLRSKGIDCVAGDFSRFDASEQPQILEEIVHHINDWYDDGPRNRRIREVLWREVYNSLHLSGLDSSRCEVVMWLKSLPSGHPLTTIINSIYNLTLFHLAWNRLCTPELRGWYFDYCYLCVLGDDNIQNISSCVTSWWNQATITEAMAGLFMVYTDEAKDGAAVDLTRNLVDCSFCKRTFRHTATGWVGPLDTDSIVWSPYVVRAKVPDPRSILEDNIELSLGELSLHPTFVWEEWKLKIVSAARRVGYLPRRACIQDTYREWITSYDPPYL